MICKHIFLIFLNDPKLIFFFFFFFALGEMVPSIAMYH